MSSQPLQIAFGAQLVSELYPFLIVLDRELRVVQHGRALLKVCPELSVGTPLLEAFAIHRPRLKPSFDSLRQAHRTTFFLDSRSTKIRLRGQLLYAEQYDHLVFIGSPWFTDITELQRSALELVDFTVHDPIMDYLYMVQAKALALEDAQRLGESLKQQKEILERTNRDLEHANAAKSQFLANTSHELRTPLNGIIGMTTLLNRTQLDTQQRHYGETILKSARALLSVVNDILDFSKIEAGKLSLELSEFDPHQLVHNILDVFAVSAQEKGLELVCLTDDRIPKGLQGDPSRLRQILDNLLGNALKFTRSGEIVLRTELVQQDEERALLQFSVKDTGIGIDKKGQEQLFQAFSQVDNSMSRAYGGTGLGLVICKQLAELMGGEIGVQSEPGQGSHFWFTAWLRKVPQLVSDEPPPEILSTVRALVVDDNATSRHYLQTLIKQWGAQVESADSALRALELLRSGQSVGQPFELAIVDMRMPGMTGLDLAHVLAGDKAFETLRIVLLGGTDLPPSTNLSQARINAVLSKPVRPSQLLDCLSQLSVLFAQRPQALRIVKAAAQEPPPAAQESPSAAQEPPPAATALPVSAELQPRLLVVDDNPVNLEVASLMLSQLGYRVDLANNGQQAISATEQVDFAAVLMDLQMPICDGYQAVAEIRRRQGSTRHTPIIAMTAHAMPSDRKRALDAGMDDYLSKPIDPELLAKVVRKWAPQAVLPPQGESSGPGRRATPKNSDVIDESALEALRRYSQPGGGDYASHVIALFLEDLAPRVKALREGITDPKELARLAHSVKGTSGLIGAQRLSQISARIEELARNGEDASALVPQFLAECERARLALQPQPDAPAAAAAGVPTGEAFFTQLHEELLQHPVLAHPFLVRFRSEVLSRRQLRGFAIQHYMYSRYSIRNLGAVLSNVADEQIRDALVLAMYEELGDPLRVFGRIHRDLLRAGLVTLDDIREAYLRLSSESSNAEVGEMLVRMGRVQPAQVQAMLPSGLAERRARAHSALFRKFLNSLGITAEDLSGTEPIAETVQLIEELANLCRYGSFLESLGAMSVAASSVTAKLNAPIVEGIMKSQVLTPEAYDFFFELASGGDAPDRSLSVIHALLPYAGTLENQSRLRRGAQRALDARSVWFDGLSRLVFGSGPK